MAAAADPSILASAPDISRQLLLEKGAFNLSRSKRDEMVKALASISKFHDFLKRWKLVGLTPLGPAGALLMQQAVANLKDPWAPVRAYMTCVLTAAGLSDKDVTDRTVFDHIMRGYELMAKQHDKSNLLCSLNPWGKDAMLLEATQQQLRDREAANNSKGRQQDRSTRRSPPQATPSRRMGARKGRRRTRRRPRTPLPRPRVRRPRAAPSSLMGAVLRTLTERPGGSGFPSPSRTFSPFRGRALWLLVPDPIPPRPLA